MVSKLDPILFPHDKKTLMYAPCTFRFFMRVLTEIHEAQEEVKHLTLSKQNQSNENFNKIEAQIAQMQADSKLFTDCTKDTVNEYMIMCDGVDTDTAKKHVFYYFLDHMNDDFQKVHGIERRQTRHFWAKTLQENVIDELQNDPSKKVWQKYNAVTGFMPKERLPSDNDDLQEFLNNLTKASKQVEESFREIQISKLHELIFNDAKTLHKLLLEASPKFFKYNYSDIQGQQLYNDIPINRAMMDNKQLQILFMALWIYQNYGFIVFSAKSYRHYKDRAREISEHFEHHAAKIPTGEFQDEESYKYICIEVDEWYQEEYAKNKEVLITYKHHVEQMPANDPLLMLQRTAENRTNFSYLLKKPPTGNPYLVNLYLPAQ